MNFWFKNMDESALLQREQRRYNLDKSNHVEHMIRSFKEMKVLLNLNMTFISS